MAKYQLKLDLDLCQAQFVCTAADPEHFREREDGQKAELIGGTEEKKVQILEINESHLQKAKVAADGCAFEAIELKDLETGEIIAPTED